MRDKYQLKIGVAVSHLYSTTIPRPSGTTAEYLRPDMYFAGTFYFAVSCALIVHGSYLFPSQNGIPVNPNLFAVNDVIGPIMQIPYNASVLKNIARCLRLGGMRFPGGTVVSRVTEWAVLLINDLHVYN